MKIIRNNRNYYKLIFLLVLIVVKISESYSLSNYNSLYTHNTLIKKGSLYQKTKKATERESTYESSDKLMESNMSSSVCELSKINFSWKPQSSFSDFFEIVKKFYTKLSRNEIKILYKFLDIKSLGYFTNKRWANFYNLFMNPFIECDKDKDCLLNPEELKDCFNREDMKIVELYLPDDYDIAKITNEIIFSMDTTKSGGINMNNYLLLKRILIGYRQFNVQGYLDKETFRSALKTTFVDHTIDEVDSEIAFRIALNLMYEKIKNFSLNFIQYFEICRLVNSFLNYGVNLGEGFITKDQVVRNYEGHSFASKLNSIMYEKYFDLFSEDSRLEVRTETTKFDPLTLRFEDHAVLEFWANIFSNYTDPGLAYPSLNVTGFKNLFMTNKYVRKKYFTYVAYSNFEDYNTINTTLAFSSNITDYDFLTNFGTNFLETSVESHLEKNKLRNNKNMLRKNQKSEKSEKSEKSSIFSSFESFLGNKNKNQKSQASLFDLKLNDEDDYQSNKNRNKKGSNEYENINLMAESAIQNFFTILDLNINNYITFEEFVIFLKYIRLYDRLNKDNPDKKGVIKSNCVNYINEYNIFPKLTITERIRLQNLDSLNCQYIDFLIFFDYMIGPKEFVNYLCGTNKNFVDETHILISMKRLNLYADINQRLFEYKSGPLFNNYDYEAILSVGLSNKCASNSKIFKSSQISDDLKFYNKQINSTLVDSQNDSSSANYKSSENQF